MRKFTLGLIAGALLMSAPVVMADKGVLVHELNGNTTFFPSDNLDYVEFVDNDDADQVQLTYAIKNLKEGSQLHAVAVVTAQSPRGLILTDNSGSIFYYKNNVDVTTYSIGTVVEVSGEVNVYGTGLQLSDSAKMSIVGYKHYSYPVPTVYDGAMVEQAVGNKEAVTATYVSLTGELNISGNYYNINIPGSAYQGSLYAPISTINNKLVNGKSYTFTGYFTGIVSGRYFYMVVTDVFGEDGEDIGGSGEVEDVEGYAFPLAYVKLPEGTPQQVKEYTGFTVNFNKDNKTPNYVAWELLSSETTGTEDRNNYDFWVDKTVEGCPTKDYDYSHTSYQRGHMCPAADQKWSASAMKDCMVMTNMCPQLASINEKAWATLENKERAWAKRDGAIWIIAGPIYDDTDTQRIGESQVRVPGAFFKVFLYNHVSTPRAIAFVYPNDLAPDSMDSYAMSVDELEELTGYDFFSALPDNVEREIESVYSFTEWNK